MTERNGETRYRYLGKVALVTGGAGGIGSEVCRRLAREGAQVVVADIDEPAAEAVAEQIIGAGGDAIAIAVDLADEASVVAMAAAAAKAYGAVDVLDNNAALTAADMLARDGAVADMDIDVWDQMMAVNLRSQLLTCKHLVPQMVARGGGAIVNMSSGAANSGDVIRTAYSVSKSAVNAFTKYLATQYGRQGVRANAIVPGLILTEPVRAQIPAAMLERLSQSLLTTHVGEPADVADLVAFLCSVEARYITGQSIGIDGGMSAHSSLLSS
jgi:NAD(P)-dependent dehydrogenase (short-subunit alcohol dehydrogenase family)